MGRSATATTATRWLQTKRRVKVSLHFWQNYSMMTEVNLDFACRSWYATISTCHRLRFVIRAEIRACMSDVILKNCVFPYSNFGLKHLSCQLAVQDHAWSFPGGSFRNCLICAGKHFILAENHADGSLTHTRSTTLPPPRQQGVI